MEAVGANRFLLTCAVTNYKHNPDWDREELRKDVARMVALFCGDFLPDECRYTHADVLGESPTSVELRDRLRHFCMSDDRHPDDYVVVYLTGHGEILDDGSYVLLTNDTSPSDLLNRTVPAGDIVKMVLANTHVRRLLLLLDTCYSGQGGEAMMQEALRRIDDPAKRSHGQARTSEGAGVVVVAAARPHEQALPGTFTNCLDRAARSLAAAGNSPPTLRVGALIAAVNSDPDKPASQTSVWHQIAMTGDEPSFVPNPRYRARLIDVDLLEQERARYTEQRVAHLRDRFLPATKWFTGRHASLAAVARWLDNPVASSRTLVVTGNAGSGKTALLGLLAALSDQDRAPSVPRDGFPAGLKIAEGAINEAIYASTMTTGQVRDRIAAAAGLHADTTQELIDGLSRDNTALLVLIDALDEAADPPGMISGLLSPLIRQRPGYLRLLLGTRSHLLSASLLGKPETGDYLSIDLDSAQYADPASSASYIRRILLSDDPLDSTYQPSGLYRAAPAAVLEAVTEAISEAAGASFLVARITATTEATATRLPDPRNSAWRRALPRHAGEAMQRDLRLRLGEEAGKAGRLLLPLAYAQGSGLPWEGIWPRLANTLSPGHGYGNEDLIWLRRAAGSYAVEGVENGRSVYRLYHQALSEHLREGRDETGDQAAIAHALAAQVPPGLAGQLDWFSDSTHPYTLAHLATHASRGRCLDPFLDDPGYLLAASRPQLYAAFPSAISDQAKRHANVYRRAAHHLDVKPRQEWASYLELAARCNGAPLLADTINLYFPRSWSACWASWRPGVTPLYTATGHAGPVNAIAVVQLRDGPVAVSGGADGSVRIWDLETGFLVGRPITGHTAAVRAVAVTKLQGRPVAISVGDDRSVRVWDLESGEAVGKPLTSRAAVHTVAVTQLRGRMVAVLGSDDGSVSARDLETGEHLISPTASVEHGLRLFNGVTIEGRTPLVHFVGHTDAVRAMAVADFRGRPIVASTSRGRARSEYGYIYSTAKSRRVSMWDLETRELIYKRMSSRTTTAEAWAEYGEVLAIAVAEWQDGQLVLFGCADGSVRVWDLNTGEAAMEPFEGHAAAVLAVAVGELHGRAVVITGSRDRSVRVWDLASGAAIGEPFISQAEVRAVAATELQGRPVVVSGSGDGSVQVWDLASGVRPQEPFTGNSSVVRVVAATELQGRPVVVSGSHDGSARVWDLATGFGVGRPFTGHTAAVLAIAVADLQRRRVIISGSDDGSVRVWDPVTGIEVGKPFVVGKPFIGRTATLALTVAELHGRPVAVSASRDGSLQVWDLATGVEVGGPFTGHSAGVLALTVAELRGRPVILSAGRDGSVRVWDLATGVEIRKPSTGHTSEVLAVAAAELHGRWVVISGGADRSVRVWDLVTGDEVRKPFTGHTAAVLAVTVAELDGRAMVVSGSADRSVRVWDLASDGTTPRELARGHTEWVRAVAKTEMYGRTVVVFVSDDNSLRARDLATGAAAVEAFTRHTGEVLALAVGKLRGRKVIVSGSADCSIRVWDAATGALVGEPITGHTSAIRTVKVAELGGRPVVVSGSADRSVRVWDLASGSAVGNPITGHSGSVRALSVAKLHERLVVVSGGDDGGVRVSDLETGAPVREPLVGHSDPVNALAVAYVHGKPMVASGSVDRSILIWDLETGRCSQVIKNLNGPVIDIALGSDGRSLRVLVGNPSKTVLTYALSLSNNLGKRVAAHLHGPKRKRLKDRPGRSLIDALCHLDFPHCEVVGYETKLHVHTLNNSYEIDIDAVIHGIEAVSSEKLAVATSRGILMFKIAAARSA
jgi:WD40 repeat protein